MEIGVDVVGARDLPGELAVIGASVVPGHQWEGGRDRIRGSGAMYWIASRGSVRISTPTAVPVGKEVTKAISRAVNPPKDVSWTASGVNGASAVLASASTVRVLSLDGVHVSVSEITGPGQVVHRVWIRGGWVICDTAQGLWVWEADSWQRVDLEGWSIVDVDVFGGGLEWLVVRKEGESDVRVQAELRRFDGVVESWTFFVGRADRIVGRIRPDGHGAALGLGYFGEGLCSCAASGPSVALLRRGSRTCVLPMRGFLQRGVAAAIEATGGWGGGAGRSILGEPRAMEWVGEGAVCVVLTASGHLCAVTEAGLPLRLLGTTRVVQMRKGVEYEEERTRRSSGVVDRPRGGLFGGFGGGGGRSEGGHLDRLGGHRTKGGMSSALAGPGTSIQGLAGVPMLEGTGVGVGEDRGRGRREARSPFLLPLTPPLEPARAAASSMRVSTWAGVLLVAVPGRLLELRLPEVLLPKTPQLASVPQLPFLAQRLVGSSSLSSSHGEDSSRRSGGRIDGNRSETSVPKTLPDEVGDPSWRAKVALAWTALEVAGEEDPMSALRPGPDDEWLSRTLSLESRWARAAMLAAAGADADMSSDDETPVWTDKPPPPRKEALDQDARQVAAGIPALEAAGGHIVEVNEAAEAAHTAPYPATRAHLLATTWATIALGPPAAVSERLEHAARGAAIAAVVAGLPRDPETACKMVVAFAHFVEMLLPSAHPQTARFHDAFLRALVSARRPDEAAVVADRSGNDAAFADIGMAYLTEAREYETSNPASAPNPQALELQNLAREALLRAKTRAPSAWERSKLAYLAYERRNAIPVAATKSVLFQLDRCGATVLFSGGGDGGGGGSQSPTAKGPTRAWVLAPPSLLKWTQALWSALAGDGMDASLEGVSSEGSNPLLLGPMVSVLLGKGDLSAALRVVGVALRLVGSETEPSVEAVVVAEAARCACLFVGLAISQWFLGRPVVAVPSLRGSLPGSDEAQAILQSLERGGEVEDGGVCSVQRMAWEGAVERLPGWAPATAVLLLSAAGVPRAAGRAGASMAARRYVASAVGQSLLADSSSSITEDLVTIGGPGATPWKVRNPAKAIHSWPAGVPAAPWTPCPPQPPSGLSWEPRAASLLGPRPLPTVHARLQRAAWESAVRDRGEGLLEYCDRQGMWELVQGSRDVLGVEATTKMCVHWTSIALQNYFVACSAQDASLSTTSNAFTQNTTTDNNPRFRRSLRRAWEPPEYRLARVASFADVEEDIAWEDRVELATPWMLHGTDVAPSRRSWAWVSANLAVGKRGDRVLPGEAAATAVHTVADLGLATCGTSTLRRRWRRWRHSVDEDLLALGPDPAADDPKAAENDDLYGAMIQTTARRAAIAIDAITALVSVSADPALSLAPTAHAGAARVAQFHRCVAAGAAQVRRAASLGDVSVVANLVKPWTATKGVEGTTEGAFLHMAISTWVAHARSYAWATSLPLPNAESSPSSSLRESVSADWIQQEAVNRTASVSKLADRTEPADLPTLMQSLEPFLHEVSSIASCIEHAVRGGVFGRDIAWSDEWQHTHLEKLSESVPPTITEEHEPAIPADEEAIVQAPIESTPTPSTSTDPAPVNLSRVRSQAAETAAVRRALLEAASKPLHSVTIDADLVHDDIHDESDQVEIGSLEVSNGFEKELEEAEERARAMFLESLPKKLPSNSSPQETPPIQPEPPQPPMNEPEVQAHPVSPIQAAPFIEEPAESHHQHHHHHHHHKTSLALTTKTTTEETDFAADDDAWKSEAESEDGFEDDHHIRAQATTPSISSDSSISDEFSDSLPDIPAPQSFLPPPTSFSPVEPPTPPKPKPQSPPPKPKEESQPQLSSDSVEDSAMGAQLLAGSRQRLAPNIFVPIVGPKQVSPQRRKHPTKTVSEEPEPQSPSKLSQRRAIQESSPPRRPILRLDTSAAPPPNLARVLALYSKIERSVVRYQDEEVAENGSSSPKTTTIEKQQPSSKPPQQPKSPKKSAPSKSPKQVTPSPKRSPPKTSSSPSFTPTTSAPHDSSPTAKQSIPSPPKSPRPQPSNDKRNEESPLEKSRDTEIPNMPAPDEFVAAVELAEGVERGARPASLGPVSASVRRVLADQRVIFAEGTKEAKDPEDEDELSDLEPEIAAAERQERYALGGGGTLLAQIDALIGAADELHDEFAETRRLADTVEELRIAERREKTAAGIRSRAEAIVDRFDDVPQDEEHQEENRLLHHSIAIPSPTTTAREARRAARALRGFVARANPSTPTRQTQRSPEKHHHHHQNDEPIEQTRRSQSMKPPNIVRVSFGSTVFN